MSDDPKRSAIFNGVNLGPLPPAPKAPPEPKTLDEAAPGEAWERLRETLRIALEYPNTRGIWDGLRAALAAVEPRAAGIAPTIAQLEYTATASTAQPVTVHVEAVDPCPVCGSRHVPVCDAWSAAPLTPAEAREFIARAPGQTGLPDEVQRQASTGHEAPMAEGTTGARRLSERVRHGADSEREDIVDLRDSRSSSAVRGAALSEGVAPPDEVTDAELAEVVRLAEGSPDTVETAWLKSAARSLALAEQARAAPAEPPVRIVHPVPTSDDVARIARILAAAPHGLDAQQTASVREIVARLDVRAMTDEALADALRRAARNREEWIDMGMPVARVDQINAEIEALRIAAGILSSQPPMTATERADAAARLATTGRAAPAMTAERAREVDDTRRRQRELLATDLRGVAAWHGQQAKGASWEWHTRAASKCYVAADAVTEPQLTPPRALTEAEARRWAEDYTTTSGGKASEVKAMILAASRGDVPPEIRAAATPLDLSALAATVPPDVMAAARAEARAEYGRRPVPGDGGESAASPVPLSVANAARGGAGTQKASK